MVAQDNFFNDQFRDQESSLAGSGDTTGGVSTSDFLRLFDREKHWFRILYDKGKPPQSVSKTPLDDEFNFESYRDDFAKLNKDGYGIFFIVNTTDGNGGTDENIVKVTALFLDLDGAPLEPVLQAGLKPTVIVQTSPGRFHVYYLLKDNLPIRDFKKYQQALARRFNGDTSVSNPSRLMRLPGFYHNKKTPFLSMIKEFNPDLKYSVGEIVDRLGLELNCRPKKEPVPTDCIAKKICEGSRNNKIFQGSLTMFKSRFSQSVTLEAMRTLNSEDCDPPLDDDEIVTTVTSAFKTMKQGTLPMESFQELVNSEVEPINWIVNGLFATGLYLLVGPPKTGKSWLCLEIALRVASGEPLFDFYEIPQKRNVLYFALEDGKSRLQGRIKSIIGDKNVPDNARIITKWTCDEKGLEALQRTITQDKIDFVIIDTLAKASPRTNTGYRKDYSEIDPIQEVAKETGACIVVVTHTRKKDRLQKTSNTIDPIEEINGTTGLAGAADSIVMLQKTNKPNVFTFYVRGRDVEASPIPILFDEYRWTLAGDIVDTLSNENEIKIYKAASIDKALGPKELSDKTGISHNTTKSVCKRLQEKGLLKNDDGKYIKIQQLNNSKSFI